MAAVFVHKYILAMSAGRMTAKGFTIGEVVLASAILTIGILAVLRLITSSYQLTNESENVLMAAALSQEGIELIRNVRDNNLVQKAAVGTPADVFSAPFPSSMNNRRCTVDYASGLNCPASGGNGALGLDGNGLYRHGFSSKYYRMIRLDQPGGAGSSVIVRSYVTWLETGFSTAPNNPANAILTWCLNATNKCVVTELYLTEWR